MLMRFLSLLIVCSLGLSAKAEFGNIDIPFTKFKLKNGLTVIVHEDNKAPIVHVGVWYKVGSKDEPAGKTGFAHLFEHLMFNGSEHYNSEYFEPFYKVGATGMNGTTWFDRTNYFQTVPTSAIDMALWMESDRMGHLLGVINQARLDEQRGVVQNEKRQGDNQPYGKSEYRILEGLFPVGHPYRHSTIGSMADLNAASLKDVREWFKAYYGAANAVLVITGDIKTKRAKDLATKYFAHIDAGPEVKSVQAMLPTRTHRTSEMMFDKVPQSRIYRVWAVPGRTTKEKTLLGLGAQVLGSGKNSRFYKELVYKRQLASSARVYVEPHQLASLFHIQVTLKPGVTAAQVEPVIDELMNDFLGGSISSKELERAKTSIFASTVRGLEGIGGWSGKGPVLARGELYAGDPAFYKTQLGWVEKARSKDIIRTANKWLRTGEYQLWIHPFEKFQITQSTVNRKKGVPKVGAMPSLKLPAVERAKLKNGMNLVFMKNTSVPIVDVAIQFDAGYAADASGFKLGTSSFTLSMLDEGTEDKDSLEISEEAELLGADIGTGSSLDTSTVSLSALKTKLDDSLELFAEVVREPKFDSQEIERLKARWLSFIKQEKARPMSVALRNLPPILYGDKHAYGIPFTGSGTEDSIKSLTRQDLQKFYKAWIRPSKGTVFVVGDTDLATIQSKLNDVLGDWRDPDNKNLSKNIATVSGHKNKLILIDKPGAPQSLILGGRLIPSTNVKDNLVIKTMNDIFGGAFTARLNMNLREDKHWSYGANSFYSDAKGQRPYFVYAPVQSDKTGASMKEILKEMKLYVGKKQASKKELSNALANSVNKLPGAFESGGALMGSMMSNNRFGRSDDYVTKLSEEYKKVSLSAVRKKNKELIIPDTMTWMIVGDLKKVEPQLKGLKLGKRVYMNTNGQVLR